MKTWIDGVVIDTNPVLLTNSLHYGRAAFEGIRAYRIGANSTHLYKAEEHFERLKRSCEQVFLTNNLDTKQWIAACHQVLAEGGLEEAYIRPIVFEGEGLGNLADEYPVHHAVIAWEWDSKNENENPLRLSVSPFRRPDPAYSPCYGKVSGNYLLAKTAVQWAIKNKGADDAVIRTHDGYVSEASARNLFAVIDGVLVTPRSDQCLNGITRRSVIEIARSLGLALEERSVDCWELLEANEVFLTSTASEIVQVSSLELEGQVRTLAETKITVGINDEFQRMKREGNR